MYAVISREIIRWVVKNVYILEEINREILQQPKWRQMSKDKRTE